MVRNAFKSIKDLLVREQNEILSAAAVLMGLGLITKAVGFVFMSLVARQFGVSVELEGFNVASVLPDTITSIILIGSISGSVIPIFSKASKSEDQQEFNRAFSNVMNFVLISFLVLSVVVIIFSRQLVPLALNISPEVTTKVFNSEGDMNNIVWMMRVMLITQVLLGISAFLTTWLNIKQRFIIPQLAPLFYNFGKIFGVLVLVPLMGGSIWGLVWGSVIGALLHIVIQYPLLKHLEFKWNIGKINFRDSHLIEAMKLGLPRTFSLAMEQSAVIVDSIIAIGLLYQSLSVYKYAVILIAFPLSFGSSFAIASFPSFSKLKGMGENQQFSDLFMKVINEVIYLTLPISVIFIVLRIPIVRLIYGLLPGGSFSWNDTLRVGWVVLFFSIGITFEALRPIVFRAFFASKDTITTFISSMFILIGGIVTGIMFSNYFSHFDGLHLGSFIWNWDYFFTRGTGEYGVVGLAASSSLIFTMEFFILIFLLWKKKHIFGLKKFFIGLLYKIVVAVVMMIVCYILAKFWEEILNTAKTAQLFILTVTTSVASLSIYLLLSYIFSIEEVKIFIKLINKILQLFRIKVRI